MKGPFITQVTLKNYKSIAACRVDLESLMFLVGPNGAGKSNFLDALKFVSESLSTSLDHALRNRGTIKEVRRRSGGHPTHFSVRLNFQLPDARYGHYSFRVGTESAGNFEVQDEECLVSRPDGLGSDTYRVGKLGLVSSTGVAPVVVSDRLALVHFAGQAAFRPVFDALSRIEVYNLSPKEIATPQKIDPLEQLRSDGSNAASVLRHVAEDDLDLINDYLGRIVPGVREVESKPLGSFETMEFRQDIRGQRDPWRFLASSMSDGTLRSFGILLATMQSAGVGPLLVGLEEPETAVHPAAVKLLLKALRVASDRRQVLVTSHSPDLLDDPDLRDTSLLFVANDDGATTISGVDKASKESIRERLFTPGELLRQNQLAPDQDTTSSRLTDSQLKLFELPERAL